MRNLRISILVFLLVGCTKISKDNLQLLNGYWEIEKVIFKDGNTKKYTVSPTIDYIKLDNLKGYRKKVQPRVDGTFATSDDAELFVISESNGNFILNYKTGLSSWSEELTTLTHDRFTVRNEDEITYSYKRFEPINVEK